MNPYSLENFFDEMFPAVLIIAGLIVLVMIVGSICKYLTTDGYCETYGVFLSKETDYE